MTQTPVAVATHEVDSLLEDWHLRALRLLVVFASAVLWAPLVLIVAGYGIELPLALRVMCVVLYGALLVLWRNPAWPLSLQVTIFLALIALSSAIRLAVGHLEGSGRLTLLLPPLLALLLLGTRAGWVAFVGSAALFLLTMALIGSTSFAAWRLAAPAYTLSFLGMQFITWLIILATLMILLTRFLMLQRQTMISEREALRELELACATRQRLEQAIGRVAEDEKRGLGAELHDGVCQNLTAAMLYCSTIEQTLKHADASECDGVAQLRNALQTAMGQAYGIAHTLAPLDIAPDALRTALERLCQEIARRHGIECLAKFEITPMFGNHERTTHFYRIVAEALANVARHAQCTRAELIVRAEAQGVVLEISDNGVSLGDELPQPGLGINIMKYRAELLGGDLRLKRGADGGLVVQCRISEVEISP